MGAFQETMLALEIWLHLHPVLTGVLLVFLGAMVGSFLNVVIYRLPAEESIISPGSHCRNCGQSIRWFDNIPILSFVLLRGRCRNCGQSVSWRYPLVELLTGLLLLALWLQFGFTRGLPVHFAFSAALVAVSFIDFDHRIIPNEISLGGIVVGFACSFLWEGFWLESLIGLLVGGGGLLLLSILYILIRGREGMGMGDVKLLAMLGAWLGWKSLLFIILFASVQGVLVSIVLALVGVKLKAPLPDEWEIEEAERLARQEARKKPQEKPEVASGETTPENGLAESMSEQPAKTEDPATGDLAEEEEEVPFFGAAIPFGPFLAVAAVEYLFMAEFFFAFLRGGE